MTESHLPHSPLESTSQESPSSSTDSTTHTPQDTLSTQLPVEEAPKKDFSTLLQQALEHKQSGNKFFYDAKYSDAIEQYSQAISIMDGGHNDYAQECSIFFGNRAACYVSLGNHEEVIKDCTSSLKLVPTYTKALLRRAVAYEASNQLQKALTDFEDLNKIDPDLKVALEAKARLPPLVKMQQEKEAAEMIAKLKDLGNSILGKFGLSTDSFQFTKDPNTGGYSVNMKK